MENTNRMPRMCTLKEYEAETGFNYEFLKSSVFIRK